MSLSLLDQTSKRHWQYCHHSLRITHTSLSQIVNFHPLSYSPQPSSLDAFWHLSFCLHYGSSPLTSIPLSRALQLPNQLFKFLKLQQLFSHFHGNYFFFHHFSSFFSYSFFAGFRCFVFVKFDLISLNFYLFSFLLRKMIN